jgi:glycosyltransferase involved in cell wall biosynthesis
MKVSIIIPTHNRLEKLRETVEYLRLQDFPTTDYEIVVVDDGSNPPVTFEKYFTFMPQSVQLPGTQAHARQTENC